MLANFVIISRDKKKKKKKESQQRTTGGNNNQSQKRKIKHPTDSFFFFLFFYHSESRLESSGSSRTPLRSPHHLLFSLCQLRFFLFLFSPRALYENHFILKPQLLFELSRHCHYLRIYPLIVALVLYRV